jgi:hypothetical protein
MRKFIKYNRTLIIILLAVVLLPGCSDWLEIAPEQSLIKKDFWKKTDDAKSALAATYSTFRSAAKNSWMYGECRADIVSNPGGDFNAIAGSNINPRSGSISYGPYYSVINLANTYMYFDDQVAKNDKSFTKEMKDGMEAEALFLRAISYFYLVRVWKNVPLVLNPSISDTCNIYPTNATENQIIKQIIADLTLAKDKAFTTQFQGNNKYFRGRANRYAILALLADVYLWSEQYENCLKSCDEIINSYIYYLLPTDSWFSMYYPGNSIESIFELQYLDDGTNDQINFLYNGMIDIGNQSASFSLNTYYGTIFRGFTDIRTCQSKKATWKYIGKDNGGVGKNFDPRLPTERNAGMIYYRYADVLLMKAEALNELNRVEEAQSYVTITAERAGLDPITGITDQLQMRSIILEERAKEFVLEGKRWFDVPRDAKRNGFANKTDIANMIVVNADAKSRDVINSKVNDTMMYYLPIPYDEIKRNKNLKQNPFYER